jgi:glucosamine-6-phosphate deaminase
LPFGGLSPPVAITLGLGTLAGAHALVILATGAHKAEAVARMLEGQPSQALPATALRYTPHATLVLDKAAAKLAGF